MGAKAFKGFTPDYAVPPGETLLETIETLGLSQSELAERTGRPKKTINEIINGKASIIPETALQFERVLGVPASFWNSLEQGYRAALARIAERERLEQQAGWLDDMPVRALIKAKWLPARDNPIEQLEALLSYFGVASTDAWRDVWAGWRRAVAFRQSQAYESEFGTVAAWLRKGELDAREIECSTFDEVAFREVLARARVYTRERPEDIADALVSECAAAGVAVLFIPELPKLRVCGATRWMSSEKALMQLTLRYKLGDHLWFTFFHEAGHILLHGKRARFVEPDRPRRTEPGESADGLAEREAEEEEANRFARDILIPPDRYTEFLEGRDFSAEGISRFAENIGIAPGIVVGRLQFDRRIPYPTRLNRLKQRLAWADDTADSRP